MPLTSLVLLVALIVHGAVFGQLLYESGNRHRTEG